MGALMCMRRLPYARKDFFGRGCNSEIGAAYGMLGSLDCVLIDQVMKAPSFAAAAAKQS